MTLLSNDYAKQIIDQAKTKGAILRDNEQIRLWGADHPSSYYIFRIKGTLFIGYKVEEPLENVYPNLPHYTMSNKEGKDIAILQKLF